MTPSKNQLIVILSINLCMLSISISGIIKWYDVSTIRLLASTIASLIFLLLTGAAVKTHYKLLFR